jgi:transcriptional regulator with GAF, ATPase, and Fis domain
MIDEGDLPPTLRSATARRERSETLALRVIDGPDRGRSLDLDVGVYTVGKSAACAFVLTDPQVSRQHLEVCVDETDVVVRDLGSTNGSLHAGARFVELAIGRGAVIQIGGTLLQVMQREESATSLSDRDSFGALTGSSLGMRRLYSILERVAPTDATVLIEAETGTGKELCAEALHGASARAKRPFVVCDLSSMSRTLIESELFGHKRGAFTGATTDRRGAFEAAQGGTLFLDEVGELELSLQPRLLRALETGRVRRLGESDYREVDVRVVAATHRDLAEDVRAGAFRNDLYHRLAVVKVTIPPLRERKEDLPWLVARLLDDGQRVAPEVLGLFNEYDWPGNVRELKNVLERARTLTTGALDPAALGLQLDRRAASSTIDPYHDAKQKLIDTWEQAYVARLLASTNGNVSEAARRCGLGRAYLHRLVRKYGLGDDGG